MADDPERPAMAPTNASDASARLQNLRNHLNSERPLGVDQRRAIEALDQEVDDMNLQQHRAILARLSTESERRRPHVDSLVQGRGEPHPVSDSLPPTSSPSSLVRTRRRAFPPSERLQRQRDRLSRGSNTIPTPSYSTPPPRLSPPLPNPEALLHEYVGEAQVNQQNRWRAKRRKLEDGTFEDESKTFSYGHKGQVVPGNLRLDLISCDGGEYSNARMTVASWPQVVLQDDSNVYCTKGNRCNLLFKHIGGMPFSLTKIVLKAPKSGYDAPIQGGMVFIDMQDNNLVDRTSHYDIRYLQKTHRYHRHRHDNYRPSQEYLNSTRSPLRSIDRSHYLRDPHSPIPHTSESDQIRDTAIVPEFNVSIGDPSDTEEVRDSPQSPRPWHDLDDQYPLRPYIDRYRPAYLVNERHDDGSITSSESEDEEAQTALHNRQEADLGQYFSHRRHLIERPHQHQASETPESTRAYRNRTTDHIDEDITNRTSTPSRVEVRISRLPFGAPDPADPRGYEPLASEMDSASSSKPNLTVTGAAASSSTIDTPVPHARFFLERNKSSATIRFDPPVAGRYILVKLWAACPNANIDIQSIIAHGFGGPRYFPCVEMR